MSMYDLEALVKLWEFEKISEQQAIGQLLVHLQQQAQRLTQLERLVEKMPGGEALGSEVVAVEGGGGERAD